MVKLSKLLKLSKHKNKICAAVLVLAIFATAAVSITACSGKNKDVEQGPAGEKGADGQTPFIGENGNWWIGEIDTGVLAAAQNGRDGVDGVAGANGKDGVNGVDGKNGADGQNGADGITPQFSYDAETGYLLISYNNGESWSMLANVGDMVSDGKDGTSISSCKINTNGELVIEYSDGTGDNLGVIVAKDGKDGTNGTNGTNGKDGKDGKDGIDGDDGVGIATAIVDAAGNLILTFTDGAQLNLGNIRGPSGANGQNGQNGINGKDGVTPQLRINNTTKMWEVSYDGKEWSALGISVGAAGQDGISTLFQINSEGYWEKSQDNGTTWVNTHVKAVGSDGIDGTNGTNGKDGRGISSMEIIGGNLYVTYTDGLRQLVGAVGGGTDVGGGAQTEVYTDGLAFYPIKDGSEYGVSIGNAIYMEHIVIPSTYNGMPVTQILPYGFVGVGDEDNTMLKSVEIPSSIKVIGDHAFERCTELETIYIPASVEKIGNVAFSFGTVVQFEIAESDIPDGEIWSQEYIGGKEIEWEKAK